MTTKVQNSEVKNHIEISGVVLTPAALERLGAFQNSDNHIGKIYISDIADTICFLELLINHEIDGDAELVSKARESIANLISIREDLKTIQKP